jgi:hypothetical protein
MVDEDDADLDEASTTVGPEHYDLPPAEHESWLALAKFLERRWFTRTWVIQEFVLNPCVFVICGKWVITGEVLVEAVHKIARFTAWYRSSKGTIAAALIKSLGWAKTRYIDGDRPQLCSLIASFRLTNATNVQDHLFALLSLAKDGDHRDLTPNYNEALESVCQRYTRHFINSDQLLEVLSFAGLGTQPSGCPSWILNWTTLRGDGRILSLGDAAQKKIYKAGFNTRADVASDTGSDILHIVGAVVDSIGMTRIAAAPEHKRGNNPFTWMFVDASMAFELLAFVCSSYPTGEALDVVKMRTLIGDYPWNDNGTIEESFSAFQSVMQVDPSVPETPEERELTDLARPYLVASIDMMKGRKFCVTERGYIGLVPMNALPYDEVFVPYSSSVPFIIRKSEEKKGTYLLVGECYIHGIMRGEAMAPGHSSHMHLQFT